MDWDKESKLLWLSEDASSPTAEQFETNPGTVRWHHAIEALANVYGRYEDPVPPDGVPWLKWADGTVSTPAEISAMRLLFNDEVAARGHAKGRRGPPDL